MAELHRLLRRQLHRHLVEASALPPELAGLFEAISETYAEFDSDRALLERSLELSSRELVQANSELRATIQAVPDAFLRLSPDGDTRGARGS